MFARPGLRIERIVSAGQSSPEGFWYDQEQAKWVLVLSGSAGLRFADEISIRDLRPGDWLYIASGRPRWTLPLSGWRCISTRWQTNRPQ